MNGKFFSNPFPVDLKVVDLFSSAAYHLYDFGFAFPTHVTLVQSLQQNVQPKPDATNIYGQSFNQKKEEEKAREKELSDLFKIAVVQPKVPVGVDPKSRLFEFFKAGQCAKGFKCKFSHDLNVQRKGENIDIFSDKRDEGTMEDWDQETLEKVVESKGKEYNQNKPTDIILLYLC
ncbi:hypothetical protein L2E82_07288 [Cichorium intybus]|uniref:Uncharacterized protein n=1 Tax=Cichorium intybus TaxID=13427 RepID=A0ACB9G456_CICIN|nr:hypothetical protein L2E82_07288 [Cichorium intybus]